MADSFTIEIVFCITFTKVQVIMTHKSIESSSENPCHFLKIFLEKLYVFLLRITERYNIQLLLQVGNRNTLQHISELEKDLYAMYYFSGPPKESSNRVIQWETTLAAKAPGILDK